MLKEKVIIKKLSITQVGQVVNFQVKIPRDALRIIGVELSGSHFVNMPPAQPPQQPPTQAGAQAAGTVAAQASGQPAVVLSIIGQQQSQAMAYSKEKIAKESRFLNYTVSPFMGDMRLQSCENTNVFYSGAVYYEDENLGYGDYSARGLFPPVAPTHGGKMEEYIVNTQGETTMLKGVYRDRQPEAGSQTQSLYQYDVKVYVWYEKQHKGA